MSSGAVVGTIRMTTCEPFLVSIAASLAESACVCGAVSVPVVSTTRPFKGGIGTTSCAEQSGDGDEGSDREQAHRTQHSRREQGQRGADAGLLKSTVGGTEICASFCTVKLGLSL